MQLDSSKKSDNCISFKEAPLIKMNWQFIPIVNIKQSKDFLYFYNG